MVTFHGPIPTNCLIRSPAGPWFFIGLVDGRLAFARPDGSEPTAEDIERAERLGARAANLKTRTWSSKAEALAAAAAISVDVKPFARDPADEKDLAMLEKSIPPKLRKLYESAKRLAFLRKRKERLEKALANWPTRRVRPGQEPTSP